MNFRKYGMAVFAAASAVGLAGCGGGGASASSTATVTQTATVTATVTAAAHTPSHEPTSTQAAVNPVDLLKKLRGCVLPKGATVGNADIDGNMYASCYYMDNEGSEGTDVTLRVVGHTPTSKDMGGESHGDDSHKLIVGATWYAVVTGDWAAYSQHIDPAVVAKTLGGRFIPSGQSVE